MKWLVILVLLSNILPVAAGSPWHSELSSLNKSLATKVESPRTNQVEIDQSLIAIRAALTHQNHVQALAQVQSLIRIEPTITDQAVKLAEKILVMLIEESKKEAGRKEALFEDFAEAMLTAKKTADIDPWLAMLNKEVQSHQQSRTQGAYGYGNASQTLVPPDGHQKFWTLNHSYQNQVAIVNQLSNLTNTALQIASYWQDYLQNLSTGDTSRAQSNMRYIAGQVTRFTYIPRSKILTLESQLTSKSNSSSSGSTSKMSLEDFKKRIITKEGIISLAGEMRRMSSANTALEAYALKDDLYDFKQGIEHLDTGNMKTGFDRLNRLASNPVFGPHAKNIRADYLKKFLNVPDSYKITDLDDSDSWPEKYIDHLCEQKKWRELNQALVVITAYSSQRNTSYDSPVKADSKAIDYLIIGENYEINKQFLRAIVAYRQALGQVGNIKPIYKEAGARLQRLQDAHPEEHAQSQSVSTHDGTYSRFSTSSAMIRKITAEEVKKALKQAVKE